MDHNVYLVHVYHYHRRFVAVGVVVVVAVVAADAAAAVLWETRFVLQTTLDNAQL